MNKQDRKSRSNDSIVVNLDAFQSAFDVPLRWIKTSALDANTERGEKKPEDPEDTENALNLPANTIKRLEQLFSAKLSRFDGLDFADSADQSSWAAASRIFKRGIAPSSIKQALAKKLSYKVNISDQLEACFDGLSAGERCFIVDANVSRLWSQVFENLKKQYPPHSLLVLELDEHKKNLASSAQIAHWIKAQSHHKKKWTVIGGGLLTDVSAFVAGLFEAEIDFLPTTLLAMADACVGGKTGVNFPPYGKNQVGLFYFPHAVHACTQWLTTLPEREIAAGGAECIKHSILQNDLPMMMSLGQVLEKKDLGALAKLLPAVIQCKADIISRDPFERGERALLNLGHTFAHAWEALSHGNSTGGNTIIHGEAVALGLVYELNLAHKLGDISREYLHELVEIVVGSSILPTLETLCKSLGTTSIGTPEIWQSLWRAMGEDKKKQKANAVTPTAEFVSFSQIFKLKNESPALAAGPWTQSVSHEICHAAWKSFVKHISRNVIA